MKYFIDTEFIEGKQKEEFPISLFRKETKPTIDLISIGIVTEDGREYYAISKNFNLKEAWNNEFIRKNVLINIHYELSIKETNHNFSYRDWCYFITLKENGEYNNNHGHYKTLKKLINKYGKTNKEIAEEIKEFCTVNENRGNGILDAVEGFKDTTDRKTSFYGYYCDYDWVVFCQLFGKMIDLPKEFPMYCIDLKQEFDSICKRFIKHGRDDKNTFIVDTDDNVKSLQNKLKERSDYPQEINNHNVLDDARWYKQLDYFLNNL